MKYLWISLFLSTLCACSKMPDMDGLDGEWILQDTYSKNDVYETNYTHYINNRPIPVFWNIGEHLIWINTPSYPHNGKTHDTMCRIVYANNCLSVTHTYVHFRDRDSLITDPETQILKQVGIRNNATKFRISQHSSSRLTLCSEYDSLIFRKKH